MTLQTILFRKRLFTPGEHFSKRDFIPLLDRIDELEQENERLRQEKRKEVRVLQGANDRLAEVIVGMGKR